jgi:hypothetical protein
MRGLSKGEKLKVLFQFLHEVIPFLFWTRMADNENLITVVL